MTTIDEEWANFNMTSYNTDNDVDDYENTHQKSTINYAVNTEEINEDTDAKIVDIPIATEIYISTKSKIAYLNQAIDLKKIFWDIPVIPYATPTNGVIKKQIKFNSVDQEELNFIQNKLKQELFVDEQIITSINNPTGRIKFKDIRKISIGISKKDIMSYRCKRKSAFYNCFVMILRIKILDAFKEFHVKVFNTGKLEIPGIQNDHIFEEVLINIVASIKPYMPIVENEDAVELNYKQTSTTVLINSNFNCGFYINREILYDILKFKYNIQAIYDPCSYPGVQCKFYYNPDKDVQNGSKISEEDKSKYKNIVEVSFMIFRTGSILIVGMCDDSVLYIIYEFLKILLVKDRLFSTALESSLAADFLGSLIITTSLPVYLPIPQPSGLLSLRWRNPRNEKPHLTGSLKFKPINSHMA